MRIVIDSAGFVSDGHQNACKKIAVDIRAQVTSEYAARLAAANLLVRFWLLLNIEREVRRRIDKIARPDAMY
jgi:hypothetical protein